MISQVVASEREVAQTCLFREAGVVGPVVVLSIGRRIRLESGSTEGDRPVVVTIDGMTGILSSARPVKPCMNLAAPSAKAKYICMTDSEQVP